MADQESPVMDQEVELTETQEEILKFVNSINLKQTGFVSMRRVGTGPESEREKIQLQFCKHISDPNRIITAAGIGNVSDPRFNQAGPRRGWVSWEPKDLKVLLPDLLKKHNIDVDDIGEEEIFIGEIDVKVQSGRYEGFPFLVQVTEVQHPAPGSERQTNYEIENLMDAAKQTGRNNKTGETFYCVAKDERDGLVKPIFSRVDVVLGKAKHTFIEYELISEEEFELLGEESFDYQKPEGSSEPPATEGQAPDQGSEVTHTGKAESKKTA